MFAGFQNIDQRVDLFEVSAILLSLLPLILKKYKGRVRISLVHASNNGPERRHRSLQVVNPLD